MSIKSFKTHYEYLSNNKEIDVQKLKNMNKYALVDIIKENYIKYNMEPHICLFDGRENTGIKIVKIRDFNWFPHMRPELYERRVVVDLEIKFQRKIKKSVDWIPFA